MKPLGFTWTHKYWFYQTTVPLPPILHTIPWSNWEVPVGSRNCPIYSPPSFELRGLFLFKTSLWTLMLRSRLKILSQSEFWLSFMPTSHPIPDPALPALAQFTKKCLWSIKATASSPVWLVCWGVSRIQHSALHSVTCNKYSLKKWMNEWFFLGL